MLLRVLFRFALYSLLTLANCEQTQENTTTTSRVNGFINAYNDNLSRIKADNQGRIMDMGKSQNRNGGGKERLSSPESQTDLYTDNVLPTPRIGADYGTTPVLSIVRHEVLRRVSSTKGNTAYGDSSTPNSYKQDMIHLSNLWNSSFYENLHNSSDITGNLSELFNTTATTTTTTTSMGTSMLGMQLQLGDVSSSTEKKPTEYKHDDTDINTDSGNTNEKDTEVKSTNSWLRRVQKGKNGTQEIGLPATISPHTDSPSGEQDIILSALFRDRSKVNETEDLYHESSYENFTSGTLQENTSASQDLRTLIFPTMVSVPSLPRTTGNSTTQVSTTKAPSIDKTDNNTDSGNTKEKDTEVKSTNSWLSTVQKGKNGTQETGSSATISPHKDSPPGEQDIILGTLLRDRSKENETDDLYHESSYENFTSGEISTRRMSLQENSSASQDLQTSIFPTMVSVTSLPRTTGNPTTQVPTTRTPPKKILPEIRIAWLAPKGWNEGFSAETTVNVLKQAIIDCRRFLPHTAIRVKWYDTKCTAKDALAAAVDARREFDPDLILGPPCNPGMAGVAMLASHWNLPIFGWVSNDHSLEDRSVYTTLVRLLGPLNQFSYTMNFVTILFRWRRFAMIFDVDPAYRSVNDAITLYLTESNSTVTSQHTVYASMPERQIQIIFQQVRKYARVIVFSVPWMTMRRYMLVAHRLGMTDGDFSFICINGDVYTNKTLYSIVRSDAGWKRNDSDDDEARVAFESVIHVIMATYNLSVYATFAEYVSKAETFKSDLWQLPDGNETIDAYAPFVYDATVLWASLVNKTLLEGGSPRNGSNIFRLAKGMQTSGVTGKLVLDHNCDRLSNVWFLDMQPDGKFKEFVEIYNTLNGGVLKTKQMENARVSWRDGSDGNKNAPPDSPICGFEGELCKKVTHQVVPDYTDSIVGAAVGSSFVFIIAVSVQVSLRCYRRRQQLESMLWQVKFEEIDFVTAILSGSVRVGHVMSQPNY